MPRKAGPGRRHEVELRVDKDSGEITVGKDGGMDIVLMDLKTGSIKTLNPRPRVMLERDEQGKVKLQSTPDVRTKVAVKFVTDEAVMTKAEEPKVPEDEDVG